jgi:undecaprenyl diphosphate synthase
MNNISSDYHPVNNTKTLHVGIIPDGGRRWAKKNNVSLSESYAVSRDLVVQIAEYLFSVDVAELSVYLSSVQNFRRNDSEIDSFTSVTSNGISNEILKLASLLSLEVRIIGDDSSLSPETISLLANHNKKLDDKIARKINLCISYNPSEEIENAIKQREGDRSFVEYLWVKRPLDLIIRSGGANLLSNFLPLQSGFARLYFLDELFNDIKLSTVVDVIEGFNELNRKFGD